MLVLSRKPGDSIIIDDTIEVMVVQIKDDKVRLGLVVPRDMPVHRKEVHDALLGNDAGQATANNATLDVHQLARDLEASRQEILKYKTILQELVRSEWSGITHADLDEALKSDFDPETIILELRRGSAA